MRKPIVITGPGLSLEETARVYGVSRKRLKELVALADKLLTDHRAREKASVKRAASRKKSPENSIGRQKRA
jgi:hypothetical protein